MSYEYIQKLEKQLEEEIEKLLSLAAEKDESEKDIELAIPQELKLRKDRLARIQEAKRVVEDRASERYQKEKEFIPAIDAVPEELAGEIFTAVADTGYFSENNIELCEKKNITPIISTSREKHNSFLYNILNNAPPDNAQCTTPVEKMNEKLKSQEGKDIYKKRKQTVEPVFGVIKEILGFRRFSLRGEAETDAE